MKTSSDSHPATLSHVFSFASERTDQWRQLNAQARAWAAASDKDAPSHKRKCDEYLGALRELEHYWAFPGPRLMEALSTALEDQDAEAFAHLAQSASAALLSGDFRRSENVWNTDNDGDGRALDALPPDMLSGAAAKPYFEVLVVTPVQSTHWARSREEIARMRREEDPFKYTVVQVASFEDALLATLLNGNLQAVVLLDGFSFASRQDIPGMHEYIRRHIDLDPDNIEPGALATTLAQSIKRIRPELDLYLLTDRAAETLAGSEQARGIRRVFHHVEEPMELHLSILDGISDRFETPYFDNLKKYARRPIGTFHALPIARGKSVFSSNWIRDMGEFYGTNILYAESSATTGGLDSLLEPTGNIKRVQEAIARAFGAKRAYLGTNGTSTSNKIVVQAICKPGDIVIVDRNCHKSHHYGFVLSGAQPYYVEAFPLTQYSMYGAVPLRTIKQALFDCKAEGTLDRVKVIDMTNCTFDGHMYNPRRVMEECLAIKPDLVFLWDEAWFGFAVFNPLHRRRTAMGAAAALTERYRSKAYRAEYEAWREKHPDLDPSDASLLDARLMPDPDKVRIRVYQTHSTHKSMSAFRQGSMMLIWDEDFRHVEGPFEEAFFAHTSTSPNLQLIASLDIARRQMELEGYALTVQATDLSLRLRRAINDHPLISKYFHVATPEDMIPAEFRESGIKDYGPPHSSWAEVADAWDQDEFALDPTRMTLVCGAAGFDGTQLKGLLAERFDIQINKTSRNSILVQININNTRSDASLLVKALADLSREIDQRQEHGTAAECDVFAARVKSLVTDVPDLPNFSRFHDAFRDNSASRSNEGHMRPAFFMAYDESNCEFVKLASDEVDKRLKDGPEMVSANFVIPYPPGFPIMVPGQVIQADTITYMRKLDVKEIHGYHAAQGIKLLKPSALAGHRPGTDR
ncbi:aminotransferase class I/II-fold pyridoxal phosphate-dependent enzyme [Novilysobacter selenitireducens]|uniref:Aminotransferase class I/II-fold pyridoxal phosphate-dependent enzyme n=1 Tax=Novilysobacter selenitireducens TaxID=2872639 RepID=A0ABS7T6D6_9GAMM|nr:aminotransferase class I/II-fold pyridoxal phosphate-dependent enzyme [Lysobacter selenitireducens]MBZ4039420.1 aminotransferase class I/II-fold pyridoxal phosphate-dependent enzyme [Lysobacter selenitireducens]